jgi:hypothetical protein
LAGIIHYSQYAEKTGKNPATKSGTACVDSALLIQSDTKFKGGPGQGMAENGYFYNNILILKWRGY